MSDSWGLLQAQETSFQELTGLQGNLRAWVTPLAQDLDRSHRHSLARPANRCHMSSLSCSRNLGVT